MHPGGQLLTFGYLRKSQDFLKILIPRDVATVTTEFVGICLSTWINDVVDLCFKKDGDLNMNTQQWMKLNDLDLRVIQDQILFRHSNIYDRYGIIYLNENEPLSLQSSTSKRARKRPAMLPKSVKNVGIPSTIKTIVCECQFGMKGIQWLSAIITYSNCLTHLTLSNNQLNDRCIAVLVNALTRNNFKTLTWLDISDNKQITDESTKILVEMVFPCYVLTGFNLNATGISDRSCDYLLAFYGEEKNISKKKPVKFAQTGCKPSFN